MAVMNLPSQLTPFVGRANELQEIKTLLADPDCRLLTLLGPGGIGKTRLAIEAVRDLGEHFPDGLIFVPLESLSAPEFIFSAVADAMEHRFYSGSDRETQFLTFLRDQRTLLLLDNFEHLLVGADLISRMLQAAPALKAVVTSRERLNLHEEWLYDVVGLLYPGEGERDTDSHSAVQLFAQSARRMNPGFSLSAEAAAVSHICRLLEGMPLAIELASSWGRALTYGQIAREIARGLDILETETRNIPVRHRSMRAVMDGSWKNLSESEREAIGHLAVFRGGFTREAAEAVIQASARLLAALVDKSWLRHEVGNERYSMHELVRQYALDRVATAGSAGAACRLHCTYFAGFMRQRERDIKDGRQIEGLAEIERDFENVRTAWTWAVSQRDRASLSYMMEALNFYCDMKARFADGEELFRTAAEAYADSETVEDRLVYIGLQARRYRMIVLGSLIMFDDFDSYQREMQAGVAYARQYGTQEDLAFQLYVSAVVSPGMGAGLQYGQESAGIYERMGDEFYHADLLSWVACLTSDWRESKRIFLATAAIQRRIGDLNGLSWSLQHLSRVSFWEHRFDESHLYLDEAVAIQRRRGDLKGLYWSKMSIGQRKLLLGEFESARAYATEARRIASNLKLAVLNQAAIATLGLIAISTEEDFAEGERLCRESLAIAVAHNFDFADGPINAHIALVMAAFHRGDHEAARQYYERLIGYLDVLEISDSNIVFGILALPAALLLAQMGEYAQTVEILSRVAHLPDEVGYPVVTWLTKMPLIGRLWDDLQAQLGDAAYEAARARGARLDIGATVHRLHGDLQSIAQVAPTPRDSLTQREVEILRLAARGLSNNQIAAHLVLSSGTVKWYLSEIYGKLAVSNRAQAIARAHELQLLSA